MTIRIPNQGKYNQSNKGEIFGNIFRTTNIDLKTNPGILRLNPRIAASTKDNDSGITGLGLPAAFITHTNSSTPQFWCACGIGQGSGTSGTGKMFVSATATPNSPFVNDTTSSTPTNLSMDFVDMVLWRKGLYVGTFTSNSQNIARLKGAWTTNYFTGTAGGSFVTNGSCKNLCAGFNGNLYICDDYRVIYVNSSDTAVLTGTGTVDTQNVYRPIWIRSSSNRLWIGLMTQDASSGSQGYVAEWDGTGTAFNRIYKIDAPCALSCVIKDDVPWIIDAFGILKKYDGSGFTEQARLPVANLNIEMPGIYNDLTNARWIHQRGMDLVDGKINIAINNFVSTGVYVKEMPSGIWEYDETIGLHQKGSPCSDVTDWGQQLLASAGAIYGSKKSTGTLLAGFSYYTDAATTMRSGIFFDDVSVNTNKRGIMETPFITSSNVEDVYQNFIYRFRPLTAGDHILPKFRNAKDANLPFVANIKWISTTAFTSSDSNFANVLTGHEVEFVMGQAASTTSYVKGVVTSDAGRTIEIEDSIGPTTGSGMVMVTNYQKTIDISATGIAKEVSNLGSVNTKIQMKTEFRGTGDFEVDDLTIISAKHQ